ncbi:MAG: ABC transporter ATP-binding protein [Fervidicoccaceae archaeon]
MDELVVIDRIRKSYNGLLVIDEISFSLKKGEAIGLVGPNGAGKSTLLKIIVGILKPDSGKVEVHGRIGYTPQDNQLLPWFNLKKNILLAAKLSGINESEAGKRLEELAHMFGIEEHLEKRVREVSGGTARKAALARSLITSPDILLLDEPYTGIDRASIRSLHETLISLRSRLKIGMIIVSHQLEELREISDKVLVLSHRPARIVREINWKDKNLFEENSIVG